MTKRLDPRSTWGAILRFHLEERRKDLDVVKLSTLVGVSRIVVEAWLDNRAAQRGEVEGPFRIYYFVMGALIALDVICFNRTAKVRGTGEGDETQTA